VLIIVSNRVELFLEIIRKGFPGGLSLEWCRFIHSVPIPVTFPPRSDMGKVFKECEDDIFAVDFFLDRVITFQQIQPFFWNIFIYMAFK
jgi:hypothetical protein